MKNEPESIKNAQRFTGFAEVYESARPAMPEYPAKIIERYSCKKISRVADLGCGTGLSTLVWEKYCERAIGIDPSEDMLNIAQKKSGGWLEFRKAFSHETGLESEWADVVVCSQSFHWMEPESTLKEIHRILTPGGIFAAVDCDWPPVSVWQADLAYGKLYAKIKEIEAAVPEIRQSFIRYSKDKHLESIKNSGLFRYARELVFANTEQCTAQRFVSIILSQGSTQEILKRFPEMIEEDIKTFKTEIYSIFGDSEFKIDFSYRMRIGVK